MIVLGNPARMVGHASMKLIRLDVSAQVAGKENCVTQVSTAEHCRVKYYSFAVMVMVDKRLIIILWVSFSLLKLQSAQCLQKYFQEDF